MVSIKGDTIIDGDKTFYAVGKPGKAVHDDAIDFTRVVEIDPNRGFRYQGHWYRVYQGKGRIRDTSFMTTVARSFVKGLPDREKIDDVARATLSPRKKEAGYEIAYYTAKGWAERTASAEAVPIKERLATQITDYLKGEQAKRKAKVKEARAKKAERAELALTKRLASAKPAGIVRGLGKNTCYANTLIQVLNLPGIRKKVELGEESPLRTALQNLYQALDQSGGKALPATVVANFLKVAEARRKEEGETSADSKWSDVYQQQDIKEFATSLFRWLGLFNLPRKDDLYLRYDLRPFDGKCGDSDLGKAMQELHDAQRQAWQTGEPVSVEATSALEVEAMDVELPTAKEALQTAVANLGLEVPDPRADQRIAGDTVIQTLAVSGREEIPTVDQLISETPLRVDIRGRTPEFLPLYIDRNHAGDKVHQVVQIDEKLTIDGQTYHLESAAFHDGPTARSGHYMAFRRAKKGWLEFNDSTVQPRDWKFVSQQLAADATLLIYKRDDA